MLRRSWFPLCAWLVLLVSVGWLVASPKHPGAEIIPASSTSGPLQQYAHRSRDTVASVDAQDTSSDYPSAAAQPEVSGWTIGGVREWWLQKIINAKQSWNKISAGQVTPDNTVSDPMSGATIGPLVSGPSGGTTGNATTVAGSRKGKDGAPVSGNGGGSGTGGSTVAPSGSTGGSGTGGSTVAASGGGSGSGTSSDPGAGALGGANSGSGYTGGTSGGSGDSASAPPPPGQTRDPAYWPFSATSPWNYPIGANAQYVAFLKNGVPSRSSGGLGYIGFDPNTTMAAVGSPSDPMTNIFYRQQPDGSATDMPLGFHVTWRAPASASFTGGEQLMTFFREDHLVAIDAYGAAKQSDGSWQIQSALMLVDLKGPGFNFYDPAMCLFRPADSSGNYCRGQTRASGVPNFAGAVRPGELTNGINHTLAINLGGNFFGKPPTGTGAVWPACCADGNWQTSYTGENIDNLYMGSLIAIPLSVDVTKLGLVLPQSITLAKALQRYGAYIVDRQSPWTSEVIFDSNTGPEWSQWYNDPNWQSDTQKIGAAMRIVKNSYNPSTGGRPRNGVKLDGGDGTLSAPLAPAFDR